MDKKWMYLAAGVLLGAFVAPKVINAINAKK